MKISVILGSEYDEALQATLLVVLREMGAELKPAKWAVAGSQEVVTRRATLNGKRLKVEAETYVGLSVSGDQDIVKMVAERVRSRLSA